MNKNMISRAALILLAVFFAYAATQPVLVHADAPANNWIRVASNGFGVTNNRVVHALEEFNGYLYAGTVNHAAGAEIWRSIDGRTWTNVMKGGFHNSKRHHAIQDFIVYHGSLYASTQCSIVHQFCDHAELWRTVDGKTWSEVTFPAEYSTETIPVMVVYRDSLYASLGSRIYVMNQDSPATWSLSKDFSEGTFVSAMAVYKDQLYAGGSNLSGTFPIAARIHRYDPSTGWQVVNEPNGINVFLSDESYEIGDFLVFQDALYVGIRNSTTGGQIWRTSNGTSWSPVMSNGFGDPGNEIIIALIEKDNMLYGIANHYANGAEVWRLENDLSWSQVNKAAFGSWHQDAANGDRAVHVFHQNLYFGTWQGWAQGPGAEVWMLLGKNIAFPFMVSQGG